MIALLFPGQGSQYLGMGLGFYQRYPEIRGLFAQAEELINLPITSLCFEGPLEELTKTENLQICLTLVNISCFEVLKKHLGNKLSKFTFVSGHSLGEFSALYAASVLSFKDTILAVNERGKVMGEVASEKPSGMYAVLNLPLERLEKLVLDAPGVVVISNYNSPSQFVISGEEPHLTKVAERAKQEGARVVKLKVSAGFHSPLMQKAQEIYARFLQDLSWKDPNLRFVSSVSGKKETTAEVIKNLMKQQIVSSVKWIQAVEFMYEHGVKVFIEVGPKRVLSGLVAQILKDKDCKILNVEDEESLEKTLSHLTELW